MSTAKQPALVEREAETTAVATRPMTDGSDLAGVIERLAANPNVDVTKLERIIALQERIVAHQAEEAFNAAFADMQADIPTIIEHGKTDKGTYAQLEDIIEKIRPVLQRHGFALSHRTEWPDKTQVKVVGILTHRAGHSRTSEFLSSADQSGSKNAIQALGSAVSYGRRYTTKDLLNIATRGEDDNGRRANPREELPAVPVGYDEWLMDITAVADNGTEALRKAWSEAKPEYRTYTQRHNGRLVQSLKERAAKVKTS